MNRHVNAIAGRLSLRHPQRRSLEILDRVTEIVPPRKEVDVASALATIRGEFPTVTDFEREFPSVCFALATGVGKTRLMGAFISYLHLAHGINNFFVLAPNLTIYNKLVTDFTPNTSKYVFTGIAEFAVNSPGIVTGDNYEQRDPTTGLLFGGVRINIFNISKINSEVRGGRAPRIKRLSEYIGQSYFDYLAGLKDLVLLMDESHRYRASAGIRAINELKPVLGLELTATPYVETGREQVDFKNIIFNYRLASAMADGFVKEPAVVTRKNFNPSGMSPEEIERLKLEDGVRLHESVKVELETYARENDKPIVKPFLLVIARDTTHAGQLLQLIRSESFFEGHYKDKVIQVDSSKTGAEEEAMIERLLKVEHAEEPTEIVIHVNMLKEGWDVTNLYTIVPLRAANAKILIEQSIGRGLRLPYGKRTGVSAVDRLNIVAHDKFQEIVDEANKPDSPVRLQTIELDADQLRKVVTIVSQPRLERKLGLQPEYATGSTVFVSSNEAPVFSAPEELKIAQITYGVIKRLEDQPGGLPSIGSLTNPEIQEQLVREVSAEYRPGQLELNGVVKQPDIQAVVAKTAALIKEESIEIPRIIVLPKEEVHCGFKAFKLDLSTMRYPPVSDELWIRHLRTSQMEVLALGHGGIEEPRLEDYVVSGLVDFDDVSYDEHTDLLYDLASQTVQHLRGYLSEEDTKKVLRCHQREIARFIHSQMQQHYWEDPVDYEVKINSKFTRIKSSEFKKRDDEPVYDFRQTVQDKERIGSMVFGSFERSLQDVQKFQSDSERKLAVILDRDAIKWFRPPRGLFKMFYEWLHDQLEYQPDFVADTETVIYMIETKARNEMTDPQVLAKKEAAVLWCERAAKYNVTNGGKPWKYALIPHDAIAENMTLAGLISQFGMKI